jgi:ABC-type transport system involved in multi-copper enzyme maturation permease subunit
LKTIRIKINPVYLKELKTSVRGIKTAVIIAGYNGLLAIFGLFAFYITFDYKSRFGETVNYASIFQIYSIITAAEFALVLFIIPALTASAISGEREKQTLEILLTTKLSPIQIILGKLASSISMMIFLALSSLPILALVFTIGGVTLKDFAEFMLLITVTAIYVGSIGIFLSTLYKKTTSATATTYGILLFLCIATLAILWAIRMVVELKLNKRFEGASIKPDPDVGDWIFILLINPIVTFTSMIEKQTGTGSRLTTFFGSFGKTSSNMQNTWFYYSILLQLGISGLLLWCSSRLLNPLRIVCGKKKRRW